MTKKQLLENGEFMKANRPPGLFIERGCIMIINRETLSDVPAKCENRECSECTWPDIVRWAKDCPYVEDGLSGSNFDDPNEDVT